MDVKELGSISGRKLEALIEELRRENSRNCDAMIKAGRGHETIRDTMTKEDSLSRRVVASEEALQAALSELRRREEYHGTNKPIKPKKV